VTSTYDHSLEPYRGARLSMGAEVDTPTERNVRQRHDAPALSGMGAIMLDDHATVPIPEPVLAHHPAQQTSIHSTPVSSSPSPQSPPPPPPPPPAPAPLHTFGPIPQVDFGHATRPTPASLKLAAGDLGLCIYDDEIVDGGTITTTFESWRSFLASPPLFIPQIRVRINISSSCVQQ